MAVQQSRIVRFLMVISIVVLTIFIYASYYSNPAMTNPTRMHSTAALITSNHLLENNNRILKNAVADKDIISEIDNIRIIDNNNLDQQQDDKFNSVREMNSSSAPQYADIPSANIQKIVHLADKILNNLTTSTIKTISNSSIQQKQQLQPSNEDTLLSIPKIPSLAAVRIPIKDETIQKDLSANNSSASKGILASSVYESGHIDVSPQLCENEGESLKLLIVITSAPTHRDARLTIRQTWGHYGHRHDINIAFILGKTLDHDIENLLTAENNLYGDLIRGQFIDSYNNLTLKTISMLEWVDKKCPHASYILKTDDDMFINVPNLLQFIDKHQNDKNMIYGRLAKKWKPIRNKKSKYYVSPEQFSGNIYPEFTTGPAYLLTSDIIHNLYIKSLENTYLKLEDVFTTGIIAHQLGIKRVHVYEFLNRRIAYNPCNIRKAITIHMVKSNEQFDLWKKLLDTTIKCKSN